jgi:hypothetical protein
MQGSFDDQPQDDQSSYRTFSPKLLALATLIAIALIAMAVSHPSASKWIAEAAQAEYVGTDFVGADLVQDVTPQPRLALPTNQIRTVKVD